MVTSASTENSTSRTPPQARKQDAHEEKSCNNGVSVDYSSWKADEVRKECTRRGLKVKGNLKKDERITILMHHDMLQASIGSSTIDSASEICAISAVTGYNPVCPMLHKE
ncbi:uncharacterized protein PITG_18770 [Phytophthora infestans T30-4]|uniref:SAP domain-containing protein n=1 Tax=Phytophthora infestans (strain T30-4) TaxID=403677 RepID=D0NZD1_PHYIT|nr:uncharacterized protein PITG_18770 [Phytophthora infestans T30-4]EEY69485.1 conserved hypothetical protein [Phytophthora infestans T30-4]|eukprot:XP_002997252.1 conserved hypothetical protein [Phytophthora infestans T30-4]